MIETQTKHKCDETFPCFYRKDGICTFWEQAKVYIEGLEKRVEATDSIEDRRQAIVECKFIRDEALRLGQYLATEGLYAEAALGKILMKIRAYGLDTYQLFMTVLREGWLDELIQLMEKRLAELEQANNSPPKVEVNAAG